MLKWLYNTLDRKYGNRVGLVKPSREAQYGIGGTGFETQRPISFTVVKAQGGHVVEFRHYDSKTDRHTGGLYIITDQEDFSAELGKLVMMECLSR